MSTWPPPTTFVKGDEVRVRYYRHTGREGAVTFVKPQGKGMYPFEVTFTEGDTAMFDAYELEKK